MPLGVNFRNTAGYATDPAGFVAQTDTSLYSPSRGYGYINNAGVGTLDRSNSIPDQLRGMHYTASHGASFRMDLPNGAGKYRVKAAFSDPLSPEYLAWRFFDGDSGVEIAVCKSGHTNTSCYQTILGNSPAYADFDASKEDYIEHDFVSDHIIVFRDVYIQNNNCHISSLWVEPVATGLGTEKAWLCPSITEAPTDLAGNKTFSYSGGLAEVSNKDSGGTRAYDFDRTAAKAVLQDSAEVMDDTDSFAVSWWMKPSVLTNGNNYYIADCRSKTGSSYNGWALYLRPNSGQLYLGSAIYRGSRSGSNTGIAFNRASSAVVGTDLFCTANWDNTTNTWSLYVDGVLESTYSPPVTGGSAVPAGTHLAVSNYSPAPSAASIDGLMDDFRVHSRILTQAEVATLASSRGVNSPPLIEGLGGESLWICPSITDTEKDISGHSFTATLNGGMSIVSDTNNGGSKCFEFDGSNDYVSTDMQGEASFFSKTGKWSVAAWVKFDDGSSTASHGIIGTSVGSSGYGFNLWMSVLSEGLRGDVADGSYLCYPSEGSAWPDSNWHHVAFVSDGTTATLYRDGASVATQALASLNGAWDQPVSYPVLFGAYTSGGSLAGVMDGRMDDIRIFRRPLSQAELTKLASQRGVLGKANPEGLGDEAAWLSPTNTGTVADISNNGQAYFGGKEQAKFVSNAEIVASTGSGGSEAFEFSSNGERVTLDQKIGFQLNKPYSISFWLKLNSTTTYQNILGKCETSGNQVGWTFQIENNLLEIDARSQSGTSVRNRLTISNVLQAGTWQHVFFAWDGTDANGWLLFVDGYKYDWAVQANSFAATSDMLTHEPFTIGGRGSSSSSYNGIFGQIDDFRSFARVLDPAEVVHLSTSRSVSGKPPTQAEVIHEAVAYVPMQEQGTTFYCQRTNIVGTLTDTNSTGRHVSGPTEFLSNAVKFDASRQRRIAFASVPSGLAGMTKYTVSAWVKAQISSTTNRCVVSFEGTASSRSYRLDTHVSASTLKGPSFFHANSQIVNRNTLDNTNQWQHVTVTVDTATGTRQSYIDGQLDVELTGSPYAAVYATLNYFAIGATTHGGVSNYHDAAIAGVGIWDKILSSVEINSLYSGYGRKLKGLRDEKLWIVPSRTGDRSNVMYPAHADTELNGSLSVIDDVDEGGTKAIQFNDQSSTSNYLEWDDNTGSDPVTVAFWVKAPAYSTYDMTSLIGKSGSGSLRALLDTSGYGMGGTLGFSGDSNPYTGTAWFNTNFGSATWHHVAMVRDYQSSTKFYVDGTLVHTGSADDTTAGDWDAAEYFIGVDKSTNYYENNLYADIDDLRVIDGEATAGEIVWLSQSRGILGGPYITVDAGDFSVTGNSANLYSPLVMSASTASFSIAGQIAHGNWIPDGLGTEIMWVCPTYTGDRSNLAPSQNATTTGGTIAVTNDTSEQGLRAFDCTNTTNNNNFWRFNTGTTRNPCTISFWIKRDNAGSGSFQTVCANTGGSGINQIHLRSSTTSAANTDTLYFWNDNFSSTTGTSLNGAWHHVVMERSFNGLNKFWLDGVAHGSYTGGGGSGTTNISGTLTFVGAPNHSNGVNNLVGLLDDVRIIPGSLTNEEITHLASRRGVQGIAPFIMSAATGSFSLAGQAARLLPSGIGSELLWLCPSIEDSPDDLSGNSINGTYQGSMSTVADTASGGLRCYSFNGTTQYIDGLGQTTWNFINNTGVFTVSAWAKNDISSPSSQQTLVSTDYDSAATGWGLAYVPSNGHRFDFTKATSGVFSAACWDGVTSGANAWKLFTVTGDGTYLRLYIDGILVDTETFSGFSSAAQSRSLTVGSYHGTNLPYDGRIDDVRIFDVTLSASQITHLATKRGVFGNVPATNVSMAAATGSFAFAFPVSSLGPNLNASVQSFDVTFPQFPLVVELEGSVQTYSIAVNAAELRAATVLDVGVGTFQISVNDATLSVVLHDAVNSYAINVNNADLVGQTSIDADVGAFQIDVKASDLVKVTNLSANSAAYSVAVRDAILNPTLETSVTTFAIAVNDIATSSQKSLSAGTGVFAFTFYSTTMEDVTVLEVETGTFAITAFGAERKDGIATATESYVLAVNDATLRGITPISAQTGSFQLAFSDVDTNIKLDDEGNEYVIAVNSVNFVASGNSKINADIGVFSIDSPVTQSFIIRLGLVNETVPYSFHVSNAEQSRPAQTGAFSINVPQRFPVVTFRSQVAIFQFTVQHMDWTPQEFIANSYYYRSLMQGK